MNLLLLLSALFSALAGMGQGARVAEPAALARSIAATAQARPAVQAAHRPANVVARLAALLAIEPVTTLAITAAEPAFAGRRRE